jgi:hypothetical protein
MDNQARPTIYQKEQPDSAQPSLKTTPNSPRKLFGIDLRAIATVFGLTAFFLISMLGVLIALRQRVEPGPVAPNAPTSAPKAAVVNPAVCSLQFVVKGPVLNCQTGGFVDNFPGSTVNSRYLTGGTGSFTVNNNRLRMVVEPPAPGVTNPKQWIDTQSYIQGEFTTDVTLDNFVAPNDRQGGVQINATNQDNSRTLTVNVDRANGTRVRFYSQNITAGGSQTSGRFATEQVYPTKLRIERRGSTVIFSYAMGENAGFTELARYNDFNDAVKFRVVTKSKGENTTTPLAQVSARFTNFSITCPVPFSCDSACTSNADCQAVNPNFVCDPAAGNRCRLNTNPTSPACEAAVESPSPSPSASASPSPSASASPSPSASASPSPSASASPSPSASVSPSPSASPFYTCNAECTTDAQCQTANSQYVCDGETDRCRLDASRTSTTCTPPADTYVCNSTCTTNAQCQTIGSNYICYENHCRMDSNPSSSACQPPVAVVPSPTVGCNHTCVTNADCTNSAHICATTADGSKRCRLDSYVNSETCTTPQVAYTTPVQSTRPQTQPELPQELPQTGAFDDLPKWLLGGLTVIGVGIAVLLLL